MNVELKHKEYQKFIASKLESLLKLPVQTEWRSMQEQKSVYCPTVDIAVGPFVYDNSCIPDEHNKLVMQWEVQIQAMLDCHKDNVRSLSWDTCPTSFEDLCFKNNTARCFLAIEIEDTGSRKQLIGTTLNAMALGRVAIVVVSKRDKLRSLVRLRRYLWFLSQAININTNNLLFLSRDQLNRVLA
jgi:hypothetical protein